MGPDLYYYIEYNLNIFTADAKCSKRMHLLNLPMYFFGFSGYVRQFKTLVVSVKLSRMNTEKFNSNFNIGIDFFHI